MNKGDTYEASIKRLEDIIARLEKGEIPLEEGLASFEEGIALVKKCQRDLERAAKRVQILQEGELIDLVDLQEDNGAD